MNVRVVNLLGYVLIGTASAYCTYQVFQTPIDLFAVSGAGIVVGLYLRLRPRLIRA